MKTATDKLRESLLGLAPKDTLIVGIVHPKSSGANITLLVQTNGQIWDLTPQTATLLQLRMSRHQIAATGSGIDHGQHIVQTLAQELYGDTNALKYKRL